MGSLNPSTQLSFCSLWGWMTFKGCFAWAWWMEPGMVDGASDLSVLVISVSLEMDIKKKPNISLSSA